MERETRKFIPTGSIGLEIEFKTFLTGREMTEWRDLFLTYFKADYKGKMEDIKIEGKLLAEMEKKAIELSIYSVNGSKENIVNTILDLPMKEYREITDEALKVMGDTAEFFAGKKK